MSSGENAVREIQADLACPQCQYNLRGLRGEIVTCPECGARCDVAKLIATRWTREWYEVPGYGRVAMPAGILVLGTVLELAVLIALYDHPAARALLTFSMGMIALVTLVAWVLVLTWVVRWFAFPMGLRVALLTHGVIIGYAVSFVGVLLNCINILMCVFSGGLSWALTQFALCVATAVTIAYCCWRGHRYIGEQCIRRYVARAARVDEPGPNAG